MTINHVQYTQHCDWPVPGVGTDHFYGAVVYSIPCPKCFAFTVFVYIVCLFLEAASLFLTCKTHRPIFLLEKEEEEEKCHSSAKTQTSSF